MSPHDGNTSNDHTLNDVHHDYCRRSSLDASYTASQHGQKHPHPHSTSEGHHQSWAETDWEELVKIWTREIMNTSAEQMSSLSSEEFRENCDTSLDDHRFTSDRRMRETDLFLLSMEETWGAADEEDGTLEGSKKIRYEKSQYVENNVKPYCQGQTKAKGRLQNRHWLARRRLTV